MFTFIVQAARRSTMETEHVSKAHLSAVMNTAAPPLVAVLFFAMPSNFKFRVPGASARNGSLVLTAMRFCRTL
ncbi:hypothetical protein Trisim1_007102 [Trichoderma cf. simile WF8]